MKKKNLLFIMLLMFLFTACADVENVQECVKGHTYGFWGGLWHGMTIFFSGIGSLIDDEIAIFAVNNNGGWYNFGFMLGACGFVGGTFRLIIKD